MQRKLGTEVRNQHESLHTYPPTFSLQMAARAARARLSREMSLVYYHLQPPRSYAVVVFTRSAEHRPSPITTQSGIRSRNATD